MTYCDEYSGAARRELEQDVILDLGTAFARRWVDSADRSFMHPIGCSCDLCLRVVELPEPDKFNPKGHAQRMESLACLWSGRGFRQDYSGFLAGTFPAEPVDEPHIPIMEHLGGGS